MCTHAECQETAAMMEAAREQLLQLHSYLSMDKFQKDTTVQVADIFQWLTNIQTAIGEASQKARNRYYYRREFLKGWNLHKKCSGQPQNKHQRAGYEARKVYAQYHACIDEKKARTEHVETYVNRMTR